MSSNVLKIAVLVSGGGSNLQSIIDAQKEHFFKSKITVVISNKADAYALKRAEENQIETHVVTDDDLLIKIFEEKGIDLIVLAGYLKIISNEILEKYKNRIINIHPSLLPKYGGKGMYGINVHKAVLLASEKESGPTVHQVTNVIDGGEIIIQEKVDIQDCKTAEDVQSKVLNLEHQILKKAIRIMEEKIVSICETNETKR